MYGFGAWALSMISYLAIEPMKDADQAAEKIGLTAFQNLKGVFCNKSFQVLATIELLQGVVSGAQTALNLFFLMYVSKLTLGTASFLVLPWAMCGIFLPLAMVPLWLKYFKTHTPTRAVQIGECLHAVISPVTYFVLPMFGVDYTVCFFLDFALIEVAKSAKSFWKASSGACDTITKRCVPFGGE